VSESDDESHPICCSDNFGEMMRVGFVIGKFMPPHRGHIQLISFAKAWVERLYIVVESVPNEPIPSTLRFAWMKELFPDCNVLHLQTHQPQEPSETPEFWKIWKRTLQDFLPESIDVVFASEPYGKPLSESLGATFIPVDTARLGIPISATEIRTNPKECWSYIPEVVRSFFRKKVCVFGPESTGKSTLSKRITAYFGGRLVPEFARGYLEVREGEIVEEDLWCIAKGQSILENVSSVGAGPLLVCDTDPLSTTIWSQHLFGRCDERIATLASKHQYDMTFLLDVDVPFVEDIVRYIPEQRKDFFDSCTRVLEREGRPYIVVRGSWEERWNIVLDEMSRL
jgi:HTH-type transcriptional repressor of NAD biosynthesis genes